MSKKVQYIILFLALGGVVLLASNPFYWAMSSSIEKQPELNDKENHFINKWENDFKCGANRYFHYIDDTKKYFHYSLSFESTNRDILKSNGNYEIARVILDSILNKKKEYLKEIHIYRVFNREEIDYETKAFYFTYNFDKDSLLKINKSLK